MNRIELWPDLAEAWRATGEAPLGALPAAPGSGHEGRFRVIKSESRSRVTLLEAEGRAALVLKIYRTPPRLAWRTIGLASRANREFTVMMNAHRRGLDVARPLYWLERRNSGRLELSALALEVIDGPDLESWLLEESPDAEQRLHAAYAAGGLLGRFHRAGLFWGTVNPRNILLRGGDPGSMTAIDMPYARMHDRDLTGGAHAMMDLVLAFQLSDGRTAFDATERSRFLLAYCADDEERAKAFDEGLRLPTHREWKRQRMLRRLGNLLKRGVKSPGRGGVYDPGSGDYRRLDGEDVFIGSRTP